MDIQEVARRYFKESARTSFEKCKTGAINSTYRVRVEVGGKEEFYTFQKMSTIFDVSITEDIEAVTGHLAAKGIKTQRIVKTSKGSLFVRDGASWWRVLPYLPGRIFLAVSSPEMAKEAGHLMGNFHNALTDFDYEFKFKLSHYHDVHYDIEKLRSTLKDNENTGKYEELKNLAEDILDSFDKLPKTTSLPRRILHGDLKISNIVFDDAGKRALVLVDLDTFMHGPIILDIGDALRSWCMPGGEDAEKVRFDLDIYNAALVGYYSSAKFLIKEERESVPYGVKLMALDLAARFVIDAFEENYFKLDASKYKNLFEQNKKRAENQFAFFKEFSAGL